MALSILSTLGFCVRRLIGGVVLASVLSGSPAEASKNRNAAILARVLSFELTLDERVGPSVGIAVIYKKGDATSEANADDWFKALTVLSSVRIKDRPFFAIKIPYAPSELTSAIEQKGVDVLLVSDGLASESEAIARIARAKHVLTASNAVSYVEKNLTLCVTEEGDKTRIIINLSAAEREGIRFSSNLLKLATLVR